MFNHRDLHLSRFSGTVQPLTFLRHIPGVRESGEETVNFVPYLTIECDVQAVGNSKILNTRLAATYAQMYQITCHGVPDIKRQDRVMIDGAECIIETVQPWGGHTEIEAGARQPGDF